MIYENSETIQVALKKYYQLNSIPLDGGLSDKWARYKFGPLTIVGFPNFDHRRDAIVRHDLHHIILNLDTTLRGEGLIAAWELGSGCGPYWISWCMEPQALWWGILLEPKKTWELFLKGQNDNNFFHQNVPEGLLEKSVGEIRRLIQAEHHVPNNTKNLFFSFISFFGVSLLGLLMILLFIPIFAFFGVLGFILDRPH